MSKKQIMEQAWKIAKKAAKKFGGKAIEYISGALKMAWKATKGLTEEQIKALVSKGYNRWTTADGKHDRLYLNICQLPQSKDVGLVTHDLTVSGNNATSLLPHYTWLHHWVVDSTHLTNTFTH